MSLMKIGAIGALCGVTILSGCSVSEVRGKQPVNANECQENWLQEIGAVQPEEVQSAAEKDGFMEALLVRFAVSFMEPTVAHRRYRACLRRVGVTDVNGYLASEGDVTERLGIYVAPPLVYETPAKPAHCPRGAGVLYGGSGYCVGR